MNLRKLIFTNSDNYKIKSSITPKGIVVHSTGANNPELRRYVGPDDGLLGKNQYNNHWNMPMSRKVGMHGFIGKLANGSVATYQTLPWTHRAWHAGGKANDTHIGFEICEDDLRSKTYFDRVYLEAVEFCAFLCTEYNLNPLATGVLIGHYEGYKMGLASNHGDPDYWFKKHGKSMESLRADVSKLMKVQPKRKITTGSVNLRKAPSVFYEVVGNLKKDTPINVLMTIGKWSYVNSGTDFGYIFNSYIGEIPEPEPEPAKYPVLHEMEKDVGKDETEVKTWLGRLGDPFNWCAAQVSYAYHKAGLLGQPGYSTSTWAYVHAQELQELGRLYRYEDVKDKLTPDAVIFKNIDQSDDRIDHIAIFKRYNEDRSQMVTIGGNESQWSGQNQNTERRVRENYTSLTGPSLVYVGYPPHIEIPQGVKAYSGYLATHLTPIPEPIPEPEPEPVSDPINGPFVNSEGLKLWFRTVAGSYDTRRACEDAIARLKAAGYKYAWMEAVKVDGQPWFRAHAGSHDRRVPAEAEVDKLIADGYKGAWLQAVYLQSRA